MSLVHADNFSIYGSNAGLMLNGVYAQVTEVSLVNDPDGVSPGKVLFVAGVNNPNQGQLRRVLPALATTVGQGLRIWLDALPAGNTVRPMPLVFRDVGNNQLYALAVDSTGRLQVLNSAGAVVTTTPGPVVTANGWYHIEMKLVISATVGVISVRVEGLEVINLTAQNTGVTSVAQVAIYNEVTITGARTTYYTKDWVIWNGSGVLNNDFLGTVLVTALVPNADVALNWTPVGAANGWSILDNNPPDDTKYIFAEDAPLPDAYVGELTALPDDVTSVKGVITFVRAAKSDGGDGSIQAGLISDPIGVPATVLGADRPISIAQTYWLDVFEVDPKTSALWTPAAVNVARLQLDRTA